MAIGPMTREEVEENDVEILTREDALGIIERDLVDELFQYALDEFYLKQLVWSGLKGLDEWDDDDIEDHFQDSEDYILEWQVTD
jgi:hypothetical protein